MAFNVRDIVAEVANSGYLKTNKFQLNFVTPQGFTNNQVNNLAQLTSTARKLELYGETSHLPGMLLQTNDVRRYGYGPIEKKPMAPLFRDVPMTFRDDKDGNIWKFFTSWQRMAVLYETRQGGTNASTGSIPNQFPYEIAYKDDYAQDVAITVFDDAGEPQIQVILREAYPIYVGDVPLNWGAKRELFKVPVIMTYFDFYSDSAPPMTSST